MEKMRIAFLALVLAVSGVSRASEIYGYIGAEVRAFQRAPLHDGQSGGASIAVVVEPTYYREWADGARAIELTAYARKDSQDADRDLFDVRELSALWIQGDVELRTGISKVFWGVAESQHLVDTINQTDLAANPDGEEKLGQPMVRLTRVSGYGDFSLFVLPAFRERTFPGRTGRFRGAIPIDAHAALYESPDGARRVDAAARWSRVIGGFDIGLHYFHGTNRDPGFALAEDADGKLFLRPYYELMDQVGLDLQYTRGGWLWKLEAIHRQRAGEDYAAAVGGFEYTFYGIGGSALDLGLLAEAHYDARGADAPTALDRDVFLGTRLAWNDDADTSLIAGGFVDAETGSRSLRVEFERRLFGDCKIEIEAQAFLKQDEADPLYPARRDSYLQVSLHRYF